MPDWYPHARDAEIHLVETWLSVFQTKATTWGIPPANVTDLTAALAAAKQIFAVVKSGERTAVSVVQCNEAFLAGTQPLDTRSDYGYALYKGVMPQGGATLEQAASVRHYLMKPPLDGEELLHHRFTLRKTEVVGFAAGEAGMTAYFCSRYENRKGEAGNWGPVAQAVIP
jgi:hypothetical protein